MPNFRKYDYNQDAMIVVNFEEQLQPNTFEYALHKLVEEHVDLSAFYAKYKNDGGDDPLMTRDTAQNHPVHDSQLKFWRHMSISAPLNRLQVVPGHF